jgi:hypothetical protein
MSWNKASNFCAALRIATNRTSSQIKILAHKGLLKLESMISVDSTNDIYG